MMMTPSAASTGQPAFDATKSIARKLNSGTTTAMKPPKSDKVEIRKNQKSGQPKFQGDKQQQTPNNFLSRVVQRVVDFVNDLVVAVSRLFGFAERPKESTRKPIGPVESSLRELTDDEALAEGMTATGKALELLVPELELKPEEAQFVTARAKLMQTRQGQRQILEESLAGAIDMPIYRQSMLFWLHTLNQQLQAGNGDHVVQMVALAPIDDLEDIPSGYQGDDEDDDTHSSRPGSRQSSSPYIELLSDDYDEVSDGPPLEEHQDSPLHSPSSDHEDESVRKKKGVSGTEVLESL